MTFTRRQLLSLTAGAAGTVAARLLRSNPPAPPLFEEIPPSVSGITWVHDNAMSPNRYLPETMRPGVAFCDFDTDGWTDIFMVNSGRSDFYQPQTPPQEALHRNNCDGTLAGVT